jgi:hypothetical protein
LLDDVEAFKVNPQRMRGVAQSAVGEGIGCKEVTEFVMNTRLGNLATHRQRCAGDERREPG